MKFIEDDKLIELTQDLSDVIFGTRVINGRIECFSCKRTGDDKKYAHELSEKYMHEIENSGAQIQKSQSGQSLSPSKDSYSSCLRSTRSVKGRSSSVGSASELSTSPLGDFHEPVTRRLLTDLILTLNSSFPDYDYSLVRADQFVRMKSAKSAVNRVNEKLSEFVASEKGPEFLNDLWSAIDDVIIMKECDIYSYAPDDTSDEFLSALIGDEEPTSSISALWSFNYFFVNKTLKRIVFFTCVSCTKNEGSDKYVEDFVDGFQSEIQFVWETETPITTA